MFDAKNGKEVARKVYYCIEDFMGDGVVDCWENMTASAINILYDEDLIDGNDMLDLMAWALEDVATYEIADILIGDGDVCKHVAAALEAEHEYGWGCE